MLIGCHSNNINRQKYIPQTFKGGSPFRFYNCRLNPEKNIVELVEDGVSKIYNSDVPENVKSSLVQPSEVVNLYNEFLEENNRIFMEHVKPACRDIVERLLELPTYTRSILPFTFDLKPSELKYLYELASKKDIAGEMRIPGVTFHYFSHIPEERLKMLEPLMLSKNDMGLWNYSPSFILQLDRQFSDSQINLMSKLADCKVNGWNLRQIATNPYINHEKTVEKAQGLKQLFGDKLREIEFLTNRNGENFLSADIQLPHRDDKPDYQNFMRVFSFLDDDVNPIAKKSKMAEIDSYINDIYKNLEKKMHIFTAQDLDNCIDAVIKQVPEANEYEILRTMQKLTQFADYASLNKIAKNINCDLHPVGGINPYFYYFSKKKFIFDLPKSADGAKASFVTKDDVHNKKFHNILQRAKGSNIKWINLEGWSDGINLFSDNNTLVEKTVKILKRAKKLQTKNENYTFNDALSGVLNNEVISSMKNYGYEVKTISTDTPATRDVILSQLNPVMPTRSLFKSTIETISGYYTHSTKSNKFKNMCIKIAEYYQDNLQVYSKQRIIESLKLLKVAIHQYAGINGVKPENIYYILPNVVDSEYKSFELITKMYCDLFGISKDKLVRINTFKDVNNYPKNSAFVVLDDIVGSGDSMTRLGDYMHCAKFINKDKHIFFCPVTAMQKGVNYIKSQVKRADRETRDEVLSLYGNVVKKNNIATDFIISGLNPILNTKVLGDTGHCKAGLCQVFPYMSPDNDSALASYIIKFFVSDMRCIKNKSNLLPIIEENTYYYDIFGTDKEHLLTNAKRVYTPKSPNIFLAFFRKMFAQSG